MFQKINTKEKIIGWYSSGPKIRPHDIEINDVFRKYCDTPVFVIIDVQEKKETIGIPADSYIMKEEVDQDGQLIKAFYKLNTSIGASLPEEIGVEFLLKDINDPNFWDYVFPKTKTPSQLYKEIDNAFKNEDDLKEWMENNFEIYWNEIKAHADIVTEAYEEEGRILPERDTLIKIINLILTEEEILEEEIINELVQLKTTLKFSRNRRGSSVPIQSDFEHEDILNKPISIIEHKCFTISPNKLKLTKLFIITLTISINGLKHVGLIFEFVK